MLSKLHFRDRAMQKHGQDVEHGISAKLEIEDLKKIGKATDKQILKFKKDILPFLSSLCAHLAEKRPMKLPLTRNLRCFIPSYLLNILMLVKLILTDS